MPQSPIFHPYTFGEKERKILDSDGHFVLSGLLTPDAQEKLTSLARHMFMNFLTREKRDMNPTDFLQNTTLTLKASSHTHRCLNSHARSWVKISDTITV